MPPVELPICSRINLELRRKGLGCFALRQAQGTVFEKLWVLKNDGLILFDRFSSWPSLSLQGWVSKLIISISELAFGREHLRNYRHFLAMSGLSALLNHHKLKVEKQQILGGGTFAICLVRQDLVD